MKEGAEIKNKYGLSFTTKHRAKLQELGLIRTDAGRPIKRRLTDKGWEWAQAEISSSKPKGQMGLGALYAVLNALDRHAKQQGYSLKKVFRIDHLQQAAWNEADEALGQALQDMPTLLDALDKLQATSAADLKPQVSRVVGATNVLIQSVRHAARRRELSVLGEAGAKVPFDPVAHRSAELTKPGTQVKIRKAPIIRGPSAAKFVVVPGEVDIV
ncbi:MAG: hypothetical protein WBX25_02175 [Rhodomicrobium sp.]